MIKILQINANSGVFGGTSKFVYDVYKRIDKEQIQFDFLNFAFSTYDIVENEIKDMGGNIYEFQLTGNIIKRKFLLFFKLKKFFKQNHYDAVHINSGSFFFSFITVFYMKILNIKNIIVHSMNIRKYNNFQKKMIIPLQILLIKWSKLQLGCSYEAGAYMFGEKFAYNDSRFRCIKIGIEIKNFKFNKSIRDQYRGKLNINNNFVIGHIGRFSYEKNHTFLIDIFKDIKKKQENAILLLIGDGPLQSNIQKKVSSMGLDESVIFLGFRNDIPEMLMCFDLFLLPSINEGISIVGINSQASGLNTVVSTNVPKELKISDTIYFLSLNSSSKEWANFILNLPQILNRQNKYKNVIKAGYTIENTVLEIEKIYEQII